MVDKCINLDDAGPRQNFAIFEPASLVRIAYKHQIHDILPAVFLHLARVPRYAEWDTACPREDARLAGASPSVRRLVYRARAARWSLLLPADVAAVEQITRFLDNAVRIFQSISIPGRVDEPLHPWCVKVKDKLSMRIVIESKGRLNILKVLRTYADGEYLMEQGACAECTSDTCLMLGKVRANLWGTVKSMVPIPATTDCQPECHKPAVIFEAFPFPC